MISKIDSVMKSYRLLEASRSLRPSLETVPLNSSGCEREGVFALICYSLYLCIYLFVCVFFFVLSFNSVYACVVLRVSIHVAPGIFLDILPRVRAVLFELIWMWTRVYLHHPLTYLSIYLFTSSTPFLPFVHSGFYEEVSRTWPFELTSPWIIFCLVQYDIHVFIYQLINFSIFSSIALSIY